MRKCCYLHASNSDRRLLGIANCTIVHVNGYIFCEPLIIDMIAHCVNALMDDIDRLVLIVLLTLALVDHLFGAGERCERP
jgi:hypothetical protein